MDKRMVDNEEQREDRKHIHEDSIKGEGIPRQPNRRERRGLAKRKGLFKHKGAWPAVNSQHKKMVRGDQPDEESN